MLVRVRGDGASAENSQAVLMHLRALRHQNESPAGDASSSSSPSSSFVTRAFPVTIDCSHSRFLPTWHEVWNLYDIAYDDLDSRLAAAKKGGTEPSVRPTPFTLVFHHLRFSDAFASSSALREDASSMLAITKKSSRIVVNAMGAQEPPTLSAVWQLAYASVLLALARCPDDDGRVSLSGSALSEVVVYMDASEHEVMFVKLFAQMLLAGLTETPVSICVGQDLHTDGSTLRSTLCLMSDSATEWLGPIEAIEDATLLRVPIQSYVNGSNISPMALQELAAMAKENMVKNFCPCCGPTDGSGGCCGHR